LGGDDTREASADRYCQCGALVGAGGAYMDERSGQKFAYTAAMIPPSSNAPKVRGTSTWADMMETDEDSKNVAKGRK
jgi:hypothetical protein